MFKKQLIENLVSYIEIDFNNYFFEKMTKKFQINPIFEKLTEKCCRGLYLNS